MGRLLSGFLAVLGRLCLSTIFLMSALGNKIPNFNQVAGFMGQAGVPQPKLMLVGAIVFLVLGSLSLIFGFKARFGATLLLIFLVLATYYFHNFWSVSDPAQQQEQVVQAMKNLALMGAMMLIMANGTGPLSLDNRRARKSLSNPNPNPN